MKRSSIALALCIGLSACSGQRNQDTSRGLGTGDRDASADAEQSDPSEDGEAPTDDEDASDPGDDASEPVDAGSADAAGDADAGGTDAGLLDAGSSDAGDAGPVDGTKLRVKVPFEAPPLGGPLPIFRPAVVFSLADGGIESVRQTDDAGVVVSDTAPAMVTSMWYGRYDNLNDLTQIVTVVAPALGDTIELSVPRGRMPDEQPIDAYLLSASGTPSDAYGVDVYAGADGCARGYGDLMASTAPPTRVGKYSNCALEQPGTLLAVIYDIDDLVLRFGAAALPAAPTLPLSVSIDQWLLPETFTVSLNGAQPNTRSYAQLWMRKGLVRLSANAPESPSPNQFPFPVARSLFDSFDATAEFERNQAAGGGALTYPQAHLFQKNRAANVPDISFDLAERLPGAATLNAQFEPVFQPSASWTPEPGAAGADAVVAVLSWRWVGGDSISRVVWYVIAPPETLSVKVPELPTTDALGLPVFEPNPDGQQFEAVEYYDSDQQDGYRAFLTEPLRSAEWESDALRSSLVRSLSTGGTLRASITFAVQN